MENIRRSRRRNWNRQWPSRTRTALLGMSSALTISLIGAVVSTGASACTFDKQISITFAPDISSISNRDRVDLAKKLIDVSGSVAGTAEVVIYGYTREGDRSGSAITRKRVESVLAYLRDLKIESKKINVDYDIWRSASPVPEPERRQVLVEILPIKTPCS